MSAAWVAAIAEAVTATVALGVVLTWLWRTPRKVRNWRKRRRRDEILSCVVPICLIVLTVSLAAINRENERLWGQQRR